MKQKIIRLNNVSKIYREQPVLKDISFSIKGGEIFGLLGPSGAGKTTVIKIITGQENADGGSVEVLGTDVNRADDSIYEQFGVVLDQPGLYERLSCYDNLLLFAQLHRTDKSVITSVLKRVGLAEAKNRPAAKLSKGMKQRLVLARALLHQPRILLLDEPTGALDPGTARQIHELIAEQRDRGAAVLLTTHNMEEAAKLCGRIALLHEGSVIETGRPDAICRKYNHLNRIRLRLDDGEEQEIVNEPEAAQVIYDYLHQRKIVSIHSSEPNLETVFMELTGRNLEE